MQKMSLRLKKKRRKQCKKIFSVLKKFYLLISQALIKFHKYNLTLKESICINVKVKVF